MRGHSSQRPSLVLTPLLERLETDMEEVLGSDSISVQEGGSGKRKGGIHKPLFLEEERMTTTRRKRPLGGS